MLVEAVINIDAYPFLTNLSGSMAFSNFTMRAYVPLI